MLCFFCHVFAGSYDPISLAKENNIALLGRCDSNQLRIQNSGDETALFFAKSPEVISIYVKKFGPEILNVKDQKGRPPLCRAIMYETLEVVKALIDAGAEFNTIIYPSYGLSALDVSCSSLLPHQAEQKDQITEYLVSIGAKTAQQLREEGCV